MTAGPGIGRRACAALLAAASLSGCGKLPAATHGEDAPTWVAAWATALYDPGLTAADFLPRDVAPAGRTIRNIVTPTLGGTRLRVVLSNRFGAAPLAIEAASIGRRAAGAVLVSGSVRPLMFAGRTEIVIPAGSEIASDALAFDFRPGEDLAVSLYSREGAAPATTHATAWRTSWISGPGDFTAAEDESAFTTRTGAWWSLAAVDAAGPAAGWEAIAIVALGDSITEGYGTTIDGDGLWTELLAARLTRSSPVAVLNAGINGNLLLTASPCFGETPLSRWEEDVAAHAGVAAVILLSGVNDLVQPELPPIGAQESCLGRARANVETFIAAYRAIIARAHGEGCAAILATIPPFGALGEWSPAVEAKRQAINAWIRGSGEADAILDFDAALRDPGDPARLAPGYDSGDGLHPNDAGAAAMADAADVPAILAAIDARLRP